MEWTVMNFNIVSVRNIAELEILLYCSPATSHLATDPITHFLIHSLTHLLICILLNTH